MKKMFPALFVLMLMSRPLFSQQVLDGVVAIVGEEIILKTELMQAAQTLALQMGVDIQKDTERFNAIKKDVLKNLITEKVLLAKAKKDTITVEDQQVDAALEERIQQMIQQLGSKEKVEEYFGKGINRIKSDYREELKKQLISQKVQQQNLSSVSVSRREVKRFYETMKDSLPKMQNMVKIRHILMDVTSQGAAREKATKKLLDIRSKIEAGASFEDMAALYSEDPATARNGGDLGFIEKGTLYQSFEEPAFSLQPGSISDVVETPIGLHLIKVVEKKENSVHVRHILIRLQVTEEDAKQVVDKLSDMRRQILDGEKEFDELAKEYSVDESTKDQGGELGWVPLDQLQIEEFAAAIDTLEPGEISRPFKTPYGYHIVNLEERQEQRTLTLQDDWDRISEWALSQKRQKLLEKLVETIKKDLYINIKEDMI